MPPWMGRAAQVTPAGDRLLSPALKAREAGLSKLLRTLGLEAPKPRMCKCVTPRTERVSGGYREFRFVNWYARPDGAIQSTTGCGAVAARTNSARSDSGSTSPRLPGPHLNAWSLSTLPM